MATQSNDFAFGVPILSALYGKSHPDYVLFLYLLSPISLVVLNPLAFALCEYGSALEDNDAMVVVPPRPSATRGITPARKYRVSALVGGG